ncbi:MAG: hypothetical protein ACREBW_06005 [Candidatus Micrarchaeaceae archaeon]
MAFPRSKIVQILLIVGGIPNLVIGVIALLSGLSGGSSWFTFENTALTLGFLVSGISALTSFARIRLRKHKMLRLFGGIVVALGAINIVSVRGRRRCSTL